MPAVTPEFVETAISSLLYNDLNDVIPNSNPEVNCSLTQVQIRKIVNWLQKLPENNGYHGVRVRCQDQFGVKVPIAIIRMIDEHRKAKAASLNPDNPVNPPIGP
jgi:hypothetical protein